MLISKTSTATPRGDIRRFRTALATRDFVLFKIIRSLTLIVTFLVSVCWPPSAAAQACGLIIEPSTFEAYTTTVGPDEIHVTGWATGNHPITVEVKLEFLDTTGNPYHTTPVVTSTVADGSGDRPEGFWEAIFQHPAQYTLSNTRCGIPVNIIASLLGYNPATECVPTAQLPAQTLTCGPPPDCPSSPPLDYVVKDVAEQPVTGCLDAGAQYTIELITPPPGEIQWVIDASNVGSGTSLSGFMPSAGNRTVSVSIGPPGPCQPRAEILLQGCTQISGCTDSTAQNYDPNATVDDGSCRYNGPGRPGCTDSNATNYDPNATVDDGSCRYNGPGRPGCTDSNATNYDPNATVDDGSCRYNGPPDGDQSICGIFDWCCWLLALFVGLYIAFWVMWHYNMLPAAWYVGIGAAVALILWILICKPTFCGVLLILFAAGVLALAIIGVVAMVPGAPTPAAVIQALPNSYPGWILTVLTLILIPIVWLAAGCSPTDCNSAVTCFEVLWDKATTGG